MTDINLFVVSLAGSQPRATGNPCESELNS